MRKWIKRCLSTMTIIFVLMNVVAAFHAYKFTHFADSRSEKTKDAKKLTGVQKIKTLVFGISNPRPENTIFPDSEYQVVKLKSNREIECWSMKVQQPKGTVILFHGYSGDKSSMLDKSVVLRNLHYNT